MLPTVNQPNWIQYITGVLAVFILIGMFGGWGNPEQQEFPTAADIGEATSSLIVIPTAPTCPTAEEIVALIEMPESENVAGWQDFFEDYFGEQYSDIKENAYNDVMAEIEEDDYETLEDFLKAEIEGFDEIYNDYVNEDEDETEITVTKLGLDEDEDKEADVYLELKVKYTLKEGDDTRYKDTVIVKATVLYDEGNFDDEDVEIEYFL